ncbi:MAG: dihydroorotate dehydrogenase [Gemmatimonadaceae bacterium]|jgi:dihydroorotate dehydrogenase (NAD+) catalytic subunit|nr:dihydroorotate dehydrogenase [Gemmatimonadaceae bacterium]
MSGALRTQFVGLDFRNPLVLASGTAGYGQELARVMDLGAVGGLVTKAVSVEPRRGAAAPRVGEFGGGMINAIGLANPGVDAVVREALPWLATQRDLRVLVNVVGNSIDDFVTVVERVSDQRGVDGVELNVSCPNVKAGIEFGADRGLLADLVRAVRAATSRPIVVKLSPASADLVGSAQAAVDAGADALTLVNTMPGLVIDVAHRRPRLGFGTGGVSGRALLPIGVLATWRVRRAVSVPIIGLGGVASADDALQYLLAGATLVGMGTAAMADPKRPARIARALASWCARAGVASLDAIRGTAEWPATANPAFAPIRSLV